MPHFGIKQYQIAQGMGSIRQFKKGRKMISVAWAVLEGLVVIAAIIGAIVALFTYCK